MVSEKAVCEPLYVRMAGTFCVVDMPKGVCATTIPSCTATRGAGTPPMLNWTPPSVVGTCPLAS